MLFLLLSEGTMITGMYSMKCLLTVLFIPDTIRSENSPMRLVSSATETVEVILMPCKHRILAYIISL